TKVINTPGKGKSKNNHMIVAWFIYNSIKKTRHATRQNNILKSVKRKIPNVAKVSNGASKSLRDRVIHLLAVRPFKKPELINRLSKDGVRLDNNVLTNLLQQVTSLDNNQYNLLKHIYPEIKVDSWPYSDSEKQIVQKRKYRTITTVEQRRAYRRDFEVEFKEYLELQHKINSVTKKFEELKENLEKCPQNSKEREIIEKQVVALYQEQQKDPSWEINKKRCCQLHSKLAYIKELIKDYDGRRHPDT
ncbi:hypothetical protein QZH41_011112, partial [Actinostola sp. cb2023]